MGVWKGCRAEQGQAVAPGAWGGNLSFPPKTKVRREATTATSCREAGELPAGKAAWCLT